ncbi:MAG: hypothetical protein OXI79_15220 [Gammaproteobacteria bacterium]|nr:hypothetical protein [Gammaproteobacteria bacterium]
MDRQENAPSADAPGNTRSNGVLPNWLDGRTTAILTTLLMVALALGAMMQTTYSRMGLEFSQMRQEFGQLRQEFGQLRQELRQDIKNLRDELGAEIKGLDTRLRAVEIDVAAIRERLTAVEVEVSAIRVAMAGFDARLKADEGHTLNRDHWDTRSRDG